MMRQKGVQLASINEQNPLSQQQQQQEIRRLPNLPPLDLLTGPRDDYLKFCLPLYQASIKCDWNAAKAILDQKPELVRYSIIENGGTALHVAASSKVPPENGEVLVKNLVDLMEKEDLALENENFNNALYLAVAAGNLETVKIMVKKNRNLLKIPGAEGQMLPLYVAALFGHHDVVNYLFEESNNLCNEDSWTNENRGLLLEKCVENRMFDVALQTVKRYPELGRRGRVLGMLAQMPGAFAERKPIFRSIINKIGFRWKLEAQEGPALKLLRFILDDIVKLPKNEIDIIIRGPNAIKQANKPVFGKVDQALELQKLISEHIVNMHVETHNILEQDSKLTNFIKGDQVVQLEKVISEHITKMQVKTRNIIRGPAEKEIHSSEALFTAAEMGNTIFLVELIHRFPDIMWKVNDSNQTIFHIAVENRHEGIYSMLYEIGYMKDWITSVEDENGNNMLHLVAKIAKKKQLEKVPGGLILQMQRELLWFKEVESMINPSCRKRKTKDGLTARELFTKEHEDLLAQSAKWVKGTANQLMVVATLVATIAFAAAITVPGGYHQDNGIPIFYRDTSFTFFMLTIALSLMASSLSIVFFILILLSRFTESDFLVLIPQGFVILLSALLFSITTMLLSFSNSFFVIYHKKMKGVPIFVSVITAYIVLLYLIVQCGMISLLRSMNNPNYLFKPRKQFLSYQNPVL